LPGILLPKSPNCAAVSEIPPPISPNDRPLLHKIGEYPFEDLTVDLMAREPDLRQARLYGTRGQRQHGGDAIADCTGGGTAVAQCKCYEELDSSGVKKACDTFLSNLPHWKTFEVRRFILAAACDLISTKVVAEIKEQKKRFKKKGIAFEPWDRIIIVQKLQLQRSIVHRHLGSSQTWVDILCGAPEERVGAISPSTSELERQLLQSVLASRIEAELSRLKDVLRRGGRGEVRSGLRVLRARPDEWGLLSPKVQAIALRLEAALELDAAGDIQRAKADVSEARRLDPEAKVTRLEARIRLIEAGPQEALKDLPEEDDLETLCARGSILLVSGNAQESVRVLRAAKARDPRDADVLRLLALALLIDGDVEGSWRALSELVTVAPLWEVVRQSKAVIYYVSALSFPSLQNPASPMPEPVEWSLIKRDDLSLERLNEAGEIFSGLLADLDRTRDDRQMLEIWRLACLANHPARQKEAEEFCARIVSQHPCNIYALPWASARGYIVDYARIAAIADVEIAQGPTRLGPVLIAVASRLQAKDAPGALELLDQERARFEQDGHRETWNYYWAMALVLNNNSSEALEFIAPLPRTRYLRRIEVTALRAEAKRTGDPGLFLEKLNDLYSSTHDPTLLADLCNEYAGFGNWAAVADRSNELLEKVPSLDSLLLTLVADYNTGDFERCLRRMGQFRDWLPSGGAPLDVKRMRIGCLERRGSVPEALMEARELVREDASTETLLSFIRLCLRFGDTENALAGSRDLSQREDATPEQRITVAELIVPYAPELSRRLFRSALPASISSEQVPSALQLGSRLELEREMQALWQRGVELAGEGTLVRALNQDEFAELRQRQQVLQANLVNVYEGGRIFIHALIDELGFNLPQVYWREYEHNSSPLANPHVLIRHGRRSAVVPPKIFALSARLNLDVTSVLLIERLQLWGAVCGAFAEVRFSSNVIPFLQETLHRTGSHQPAWDRGQRQVVELWQSALVTSDAGHADLVVADSQPPHTEVPYMKPRVIAEILRAQGRLDNAEYEQAIQVLGGLSEGENSSALPGKISKVYCSGSTAILLSVAGLLRPLTSIAVVAADLALLEWLRASAALQSERATVEQGLKKLIEFLGHEIQAGRLKLIPELARENRIDKPCARCVADLLLFEPSADDVICIDDRFMNGHWTRDNDIDITSTFDLLSTLVKPLRANIAETLLVP
jgi:tetratricopeptide (TPR) repeat protein